MEISAGRIAALVDGVVDGDDKVTVNTFAKIEEGHPGALSFLANPKYARYVYGCKSSVILVARDFVAEQPVEATLVRVDDPYATIAHLMTMVAQMSRPVRCGVETPVYVAEGVVVPDDAYVGAFAYVGAGSTLGAGVQIYPQAYVGDGCTIGEGTIIYAGARIYPGCVIGCGCIIHSGAVIGADGFGFAPVGDAYEKIPQMGNVVIEDNVEIGANTAVDRATMGSTVIKRGVKLDNLIQIAHNCVVGENTVMASQAGVAGSTKIGSHCMIGGQVGIVGHSRVGDRTEIAAQSGVARSTGDGERLMGAPAIDFGTFARREVLLKKLPALFADVAELKKTQKSK